MDNDKNRGEGGSARLLRLMLEGMTSDVDDFHNRVIGLPVVQSPTLLPEPRHVWAKDFLQEELNEYCDAWANQDLEDAVDALVDLVYVAIGRLLEMGIPPQEAWDVVHRANMAKVRGKSPHRNSETDAAKPENWEPPDHGPMIAALALRAAVAPALLEATAVRLRRGAVYNDGMRREDHFPFGARSVFQMMHVKHMRMLADLNAGRPVTRDHPVDLINYAGFLVDLLDGREMR